MIYNKELFEPLDKNNNDIANHCHYSDREDTVRQFEINSSMMVGLTVIVILGLMALIGPYISGYSYDEQNLNLINQAPGADHWFGTDSLGRDLFTRVWLGARISLTVGVVTSIICLVIGVAYGGLSGFLGGRTDTIMMRIIEIISSIPFILYVILLLVILGPGMSSIFIALGLSLWVQMARIVRGEMLILREQEYVLAAKTLGGGTWHILFKHLIPNCLGSIIVTVTFTIPEAIFAEAFLSFIGLGVQIPAASWGVLTSEGVGSIGIYPWQLLFPASLITITMLGFNFLGNGLRDALDPRLRK